MTNSEPKRPASGDTGTAGRGTGAADRGTGGAERAGYRGTLPPRGDHLARPWLLVVAGIFVLIFVLAFLGIPSRLIPDPTPVPVPTTPPTTQSPAPTDGASPSPTLDDSPAPSPTG
jgi:hypothetical protein